MSRRDLELQIAELSKCCGEVLHDEWDPIGVSGESGARDEYGCYVPDVVRLIVQCASEQELAVALMAIEIERMGLPGREREARLAARAMLRCWDRLLRRMRVVAKIPSHRQPDGARVLVLEWDSDSGGWFLYVHERVDAPSLVDSWHPSRDAALRQAERDWGVGAGDWRTAPR